MGIDSISPGSEIRRAVNFFAIPLLILYLPVMTFARFLRGGQGTSDLSLVQIGFIILLVSVVFLWVVSGATSPFRMPWVSIWILLFLSYSALTLVYVAYHDTDPLAWARQWYEFGGLFIVVILSSEIIGRDQVQYLLRCVLIASTLISIQGILINIINFSEGSYPFIFGLTGLPSTLYIWGTITSFAFLIPALYRSSTRRIALFTVVFSIHVARLLIDLRRLPILVAGIGGIVVILINRQKVWRILRRHSRSVAIVLAIGMATLTWPVALLSNRFLPRNLLRGILVRFEASRQALAELSQNPIIGRGYIPEFNPGYEIMVQGSVKSVATVHNLYAYILANGGIAGFALFGLIVLSLFRLSIRTIVRSIDDIDRDLFSAAFGIFISMLVFFTFSVRSYQIDTMLTFAVVASVITHHGIKR